MANLSAILSGINRIRNGTAQQQITSPSNVGASNYITANASAVAGTFGAWVQIEAAGVLTGHELSYILVTPVVAAELSVQIQYGEGAGGSEANKGDFAAHVFASTLAIIIVNPPKQVTASVRTAVRVTDNGNGSNGYRLIFGWTPRPT